MSQSDMDKSYFVAFCIEQYKALNEMDGAAVASGRRRIVSDVDRPQLTNHMLELVSATIFLGITSTLTISYRGDLVAVPLWGLRQ